jgi:hypothetical protein
MSKMWLMLGFCMELGVFGVAVSFLVYGLICLSYV